MNVFDYEKVKDPLYFADGCVEAHSDHRYYGSAAELAYGEERFKESLNGLWKFHYAKNYQSTVPGFEKPEYDCGSWAWISGYRRTSRWKVMTSRSMRMYSIRGKERRGKTW